MGEINKNYKLANEIIADIIKENNIKPGEYYCGKALEIAKKIYKNLNEFVDKELKQYNWLEVHYILLEYYSKKIYELDNKDKHDEFLKHQIYILAYFIELNLDKSYSGSNAVDTNKINILIELVSYMYILQEDITTLNIIENDYSNNSKAKKYLYICINENLTIVSCLNNNTKENYDHYFHIEHDSLKNISKEITYTLSNELGIDFLGYMLIVMLFAQKSVTNDLKPFQIELNNVLNEIRDKKCNSRIIKINYDEFISKLEIAPIGIKNKKEWLSKILNYLIIDKEKIKYVGDKKNEYINIDYRFKRENRFDLKPIVKKDDILIFSRESLYTVFYQWNYCFEYFYLPYDFSLDKSKKLLRDKKKTYEKDIVSDVYNLLRKNNYKVVSEFKVDKILKDKSLVYLGGYDIIATNDKNKEILIIECKFIKLSRDKIEALDQQKEFYGTAEKIIKKYISHTEPLKYYDEKFQRRIYYMQDNYKKILIKNNLIDINIDYNIKSFMIFNRYFPPLFKEVDFEVLSFNKFKELLESNQL